MTPTNSPIHTSSTPAAAPAAPAGDAPPALAHQLAHAVLVGAGIEERMGQTLRDMGERGFNVGAADLLRLHIQNTDLALWTQLASAGTRGLADPLKETAGKLD
jgi:hypothetical protein